VHPRIALAVLVALIVLTSGALAPAAGAAQDPLRAGQWALDAIHLDGLLRARAQPAPTGAGVVVAVVDSGVDSDHPDLGGRVIAGPDFIDGGAPDDARGHGTHLAGIIAAASGNGIGGAGIAPRASLLAIRVLNADNDGSASTVARGIDAATDRGADVINLSLNWTEPNEDLTRVIGAMRRAADAGIVLVVAAGNDGQDHCQEPVLAGRALCVGALDDQLRLAPYSSHGRGLGLVAPGSSVVSTWLHGGYAPMTGTSQAAAQVSGVAALLVGLGLRGDQVIARLIRTARDLGPAGYDANTGFGVLDAARAVDGATEGGVPALLSIGAPRSVAQRTVRRHGLSVRCDAARAGTCRVRIRAHGVTVASGSHTVNGTGPVLVRARPTPAGRRVLTGRRTLRGRIEMALTGAPGVRREVMLRAR
jgi:subtilisin family serine protease